VIGFVLGAPMTCTGDAQNRQPNLLRCKHTPVLTPKANLNSMRKGFTLGLKCCLRYRDFVPGAEEDVRVQLHQ
jgi:hypothetical protein